LKIGIFHTTLPSSGRKVGGVEVFVDRLGRSLASSNYNVEVISLSPCPEGSPYKHRQIFKSFPFLYRRRAFRLYIIPILLNFVDFRKYDIVHLNGDDWFFLLRSGPTIRTFYGSALWEARSATSVKRRVSQYLVYPLEHLAGRLANLVLAIGNEATEIYRADGIAKLFISNSRFFAGEKTKEPSFVFIGTWRGRKRGQFVAELFLRDVLPRFPTAKLFMACDFVPVSNSIIDLEHPSDERLAEVIRQAWGLLSASMYEGFGIPYLEALSSGTVVITTQNSGADYVLEHGKYGFIVKEVDFSDTVIKLIEDSSLRDKYEELGIARALEFSEKQVVLEHIKYYEMAIIRYAEQKEK
jgi:phosphatidyl-myo-inositol alpha-mannosyltransferase